MSSVNNYNRIQSKLNMIVRGEWVRGSGPITSFLTKYGTPTRMGVNSLVFPYISDCPLLLFIRTIILPLPSTTVQPGELLVVPRLIIISSKVILLLVTFLKYIDYRCPVFQSNQHHF